MSSAEHKTWKCPKKTASDPPGLLHATMNEVGRHGIFLFGGQSKRLSNAVYRCDPSTMAWSVIDTVGVNALHPVRTCHLYDLTCAISMTLSQHALVHNECLRVCPGSETAAWCDFTPL